MAKQDQTSGKSIVGAVAAVAKDAANSDTGDFLSGLIQQSQYIGEVFSLDYEEASLMVHDYARREAGGIPNLSFLVATRFTEGSSIAWSEEWASVILLRVTGKATLPSDAEALAVRIESAKKATGEIAHWDAPENMDAHTAHLLSFAGVKCRVIGTFYVEPRGESGKQTLALKFGSDISNYYPNQGLKVYKPNATALQRIVNYRDPERVLSHQLAKHEVSVGKVRYASTSRGNQGVTDVAVNIAPADLLAQKTALFGMTRTGKSNSVKVMVSSIFNLRYSDPKIGRIGTLIFDYNGEYANENVQDASGNQNAAALKNIWQRKDGKGDAKDVITYGLTAHPSDPGRRLLKINFFSDETLQAGKEYVDAALAIRTEAQYVKNFASVDFRNKPDPTDASATCRYNRRILLYKGVLVAADFATSGSVPSSSKLFNPTLIEKMKNFANQGNSNYGDIRQAGKILEAGVKTWSELRSLTRGFYYFTKDDEYRNFDSWYRGDKVAGYPAPKSTASGDPYLDQATTNILGIMEYAGGLKYVGDAQVNHEPNLQTDFATAIYGDLKAGRLVIVDQSAGDENLNRAAAERIMGNIFSGNMAVFRSGGHPPEILIFAEEAHNLLPSGDAMSPSNINIWVRTAKEGAKLRIGFIYATQEVSSIHKNILKNTANWFIGHLNNTDETRELNKFYDFADFENSILRADDKGFIRVKTISNKYVVPVQVNKFEVLNAL